MVKRFTRVHNGKARCAKCKRRKLLHLFNKHRKRDDVQGYCKSCDLKRQRTAERKQQHRRAKTLRQYGVTEEQYQALYKKQNGKCALCGNPETDARHGRLSIDHNHETGEIRGLLCGRCNMAIGLLRDDPVLARRVAAYLLGGVGDHD